MRSTVWYTFEYELQPLLFPVQVQEAMANVAMKSESSQPQATSSEQELSASLSSKAPKPATSAYRGIPLALLEKVTSHQFFF